MRRLRWRLLQDQSMSSNAMERNIDESHRKGRIKRRSQPQQGLFLPLIFDEQPKQKQTANIKSRIQLDGAIPLIHDRKKKVF